MTLNRERQWTHESVLGSQDGRDSPRLTAGRLIEQGSEANVTAIRCQVHDGKHKVRGVYSANFNGKITRNEPYSGTYTVEADCTGTAMFTDGTQYDLFIDPDGSMFTFVQTRPKRFVTSGTAQRVGH